MNKSERKEYWEQYYKSHIDDKKEYHKKWYESNKEKIKEQQKKYRFIHQKQLKECMKKYYESNKEKIKEQQKHYQLRHREVRSNYIKQHYKTNKKQINLRHTQYRLTHKEYFRIKSAERERFIRTDIILNQSFPESNLHHIRNGVAIYIPISIHTSVRHNLKSGQNMDIINEQVNSWLIQNNIQVMRT